jgi:uncharacterized membrane protein YbhN (UPF0104 family)
MKRWLFTAFSFTVAILVSVHAVRGSAPDGVSLSLPPLAHALALAAFVVEIISRTLKICWSGKAVGVHIPFWTGVRVCLGGDFGASITPARAGAEPARYLILYESGLRGSPLIIVLYAELFFEMISLVIVASAMLLIFDATRSAAVAVTATMGMYAASIFAVAGVATFLARRNLGDTPAPWATRLHLTGKRWAFIKKWVDRIRDAVTGFRTMHRGWGAASCLVSVVHVAVRFTILPALVLTTTSAVASVPIGPLILWPFSFIYGAAIVPAPAGGGAVELAFRASLGGTIPAATFAAALVWWRFYTFYLYIALGALVAGNTALRAIRDAEEVEEELERSE